MAERRVVFVLALLSIAIVRYAAASSLIPLIGWSNSDVLSTKIPTGADISALADELHLDSVDSVVVFRTPELTFDDIVKFGGSFGGTNTKFAHLEQSVKTSRSSLWTGITGDFVQALTLSLKTSAQTYSGKHDKALPTSSKLVVVELDGGFGDNMVGTIMNQLEDKKESYVAFYTASKLGTRGIRAAAASTSSVPVEYSCLPNYGKVFVDSKKTTCMLFCLTGAMTLSVTYNNNVTSVPITDSTQYAPNFFNSSADSTGDGLNGTVNQCTLATSSDFQNQSIAFSLLANASYPGPTPNVTNLTFAFIFPTNTTAPNQYFWTMAVCVKGKYLGDPFYAILTRSPSLIDPNNQLYVPKTNSYACSSVQFSVYTPQTVLNSLDTSLWSNCGFENLTSLPPNYNLTVYDSSGRNLSVALTIAGIQVQPYVVPISNGAPSSNSFDTPYNCEGYFSIPVLMGVFSVAILLIILYLGNVFMFSMKSLDRLDDPRAPTISVDRLH